MKTILSQDSINWLVKETVKDPKAVQRKVNHWSAECAKEAIRTGDLTTEKWNAFWRRLADGML